MSLGTLGQGTRGSGELDCGPGGESVGFGWACPLSPMGQRPQSEGWYQVAGPWLAGQPVSS